MDTRWNNTAREPEPVEMIVSTVNAELTGSPEPKETGNRGGGILRAVAAFLAFVLGVSLTVGSLAGTAGRLLMERDTQDWWKRDWQETESFRWEVSGYLEEFLTLAAGGTLGWYDSEIAREYGIAYTWKQNTVAVQDYAASDASTAQPGSLPRTGAADANYQTDKNVLYSILRQGQSVYNSSAWYSNLADGQTLDSYDTLPEGYNFLLIFENSKVSIWKDGVELDVYGDGIYDEASLWFVPGYENFKAGRNVSRAKVSLAVRKQPIQYFQGDYANGGVSQITRMYWLYRSSLESQSFYRQQALLLGCGVLCLAVWFALRKSRVLADRKLASISVHIWTEFRFLAVAACLLCLSVGNSYLSEMVWSLRYGWFEDWPYLGGLLGRYLLCLPVSSVPALLALIWTVWLIRNDHRHNPREARRSLMKLVSARSRKYPFQKRINLWNAVGAASLILLVLASFLALTSMGYGGYDTLFWMALALPCLTAALTLLALRRSSVLAHDAGLLADQVEAIRDGDLTIPLDLPADADLRQTAEHLNDIQSGMHKALQEQTRSERMKVELISNVSHDLKTPLTSILSYAELLRQEELSPAAADYARIIDEKAQRLKTMVQDVFDVSKATADQLPVHLEQLDLGKLLRQTLADMEDPIQKSPLTFKTDLPQEPVLIVADGKRLYRVFQNLIQNALQYALEGSRVYLTLTAGGGQAEASVRNTSRWELAGGVDFTARFVRGDESRTDGGSGLGLSIASSFTEACGGQFRVETVADLFTAVVTFPLAAEDAAPADGGEI